MPPVNDSFRSAEHSAPAHNSFEAQEGEMGSSMSPPSFGLTASAGDAPPANNGGQVSQMFLDDFFDGIGDALNIRDNEEEKDREEEIEKFTGKTYGPMTYTNPSSSGSGFQATYRAPAKALDIEIRGKVRFADGLIGNGGTVSSGNSFMNNTQLVTLLNTYPDLQAQILPFYAWRADEKEIHRIRFLENVQQAAEMWSTAGHTFQVAEAGWEAVTATPNVNVNIQEGEAVTQTENYGFRGWRTRTDEGASDHVQIEIVKNPSVADAAQINNLVGNFLAVLAAGVTETGVIGNLIRNNILSQLPPNSDARAVRSYLGNDPGDRNSDPAGFNNFMSLESDRSDDPNDVTYTHTVYFKAGTAEMLDSGGLESFLQEPRTLLQNPSRRGTVTIDLDGYSRAAGETADNAILVDQRLSAVSNAINSQMDADSINISAHVDPAAQTNNTDIAAEADSVTNYMMHRPSQWDRVDIVIEHSGRGGQNVLSHELGHNMGLGDEYVSPSRPAGNLATHDDEAKNAGLAGGSVVGSDNTRMMESGNDIQPVHYSTFADSLNQLTGKTWNII